MTSTRGVTMLELIGVMGVLAILLGFGALTVDRSRFAVNQAATGLANNVARVRFEAIRNNASAYMDLATADAGSYVIWADQDGDGTRDAGEVVVDVDFGTGELSLVQLSALASLGVPDTQARLAFDRRGFPIMATPWRITLANDDVTSTRTVVVSAVGEVEVE